MEQLTTFVCQAKEPTVYDKFYVYPIGLLISCVFLAITLIVYLSLPKVSSNPFSLGFTCFYHLYAH